MGTSQPQPELWTIAGQWDYVTWRCQTCGQRGPVDIDVQGTAREHACKTGHEVLITRRHDTLIAGVRS